MSPDLMLLLATVRRQELQADARRHDLLRLATCCRPSVLRARLRALRARIGELLDEPCCA